MDVMRTIASFLGTIEEEDPKTNGAIAISNQTCGSLWTCPLYWYHYHKSGIRIDGNTGSYDSVALNFMKLFKNGYDSEIDPLIVKAFDVSLILYAEHGI